MLYCAHQLREMDPEVVAESAVDGYVWKNFVRTGKWIARYEDNPTVRKDTVKKIAELAKKEPKSKLKYLGVKLWFRARLLCVYPSVS